MPSARTSRHLPPAIRGPAPIAAAYHDESGREHDRIGRLDPARLISALQPFLVVGVAATVAGGVVAAITGVTGWDRGSWAAAYLVLVAGVGQIGLAAGQAMFADRPPSRRRRALQAGMFNAGSTLVIAGTLAAMLVGVTIGSVAVLTALVSFRRGRVGHEVAPAWLGRVYTLLLAVLIVSTPIGLVMAWTGA